MRKHFLTTVAALAIATPALAADLSGGYVPPSGDPVYSSAPMVVGDIELGLSWLDFDFNDEKSADVRKFSGWARANVAFGNTWNLLAETGGDAIFGGDVSDGFSQSAIGANAHIWGGANGLRYGAFGGVSFGVDGETTWPVFGVEAEVDMGNVTLGGQGFYSWFSPDGCGDCDAYGARGWVDYYFMPNTKVTGELAWTQVNDFFAEENTIFGGSARVTHRFADMPINIFAEAGYWNVDSSGECGICEGDGTTVSGGITILLDGAGSSQQTHDQMVPFSFRHPISALID